MIDIKVQRAKYVLGDFLASNVAWLTYNCIRWAMDNVHGFFTLPSFLLSKNVLLGQLLFPLIMLMVHYLSGYYNEVFRKSRLAELLTTLGSSLINSLIIFFVALLNDVVQDQLQINYEMILLLWLTLFSFTYVVRVLMTTYTARQIHRRRWFFRTLIVGSGQQAYVFSQRLDQMQYSNGNKILGFVNIPGENKVKNIDLPTYDLKDLSRVVEESAIEEIIIVPSRIDDHTMMRVIDNLYPLNIPIKITPNKTNILMSKARMNNFYGDPLVDISSSSMSHSGQNIKRVTDLLISVIVLLALIPAFIVVAIFIKLDSKGKIIYCQERVGYRNKPFHILKFRSMVSDAEAAGKPQLSSEDDPRITKVGHFLRKYRIDELPQFWNVLRGEMSLVGPRPERQFYVDQILKRRPDYAMVHRVLPGITSMGQVKFGYAENIDEMIERLDYDLLYLENMSLLNDLKIMAYTLKIVFTGKGV